MVIQGHSGLYDITHNFHNRDLSNMICINGLKTEKRGSRIRVNLERFPTLHFSFDQAGMRQHISSETKNPPCPHVPCSRHRKKRKDLSSQQARLQSVSHLILIQFPMFKIEIEQRLVIFRDRLYQLIMKEFGTGLL